MVGWLVGGLDGLVGWLVSWLVGWLVWLVGWLIGLVLALVGFGFGRFGLVFGSGLVLVDSVRFGSVWCLVLVQLSWLSFWSAQICRGLVLVMSEQFFST